MANKIIQVNGSGDSLYPQNSTYTSSETIQDDGMPPITASRVGNVVMIAMLGTVGITCAKGTWQTICTLPEKYRPTVNVPVQIFYGIADSEANIDFNVTTAGLVRIRPRIKALDNSTFNCYVCYPTLKDI